MPARGEPLEESVLLVESIRKNAGAFAAAPIVVLLPDTQEEINTQISAACQALGAKCLTFPITAEALQFPYAAKVAAAAAAEEYAAHKTRLMIWLDSDTVFVREPKEFHLHPTKSLGYRPVMLQNIGLAPDAALDEFWQFIYTGCGTPAERIFPLFTTMDTTPIRAQFNAGLLVVRPERQLLRRWQENFTRLYREPVLTDFYKQHVRYAVFVHQAVLAATLLSELTIAEMQDLGPRLNFPIFLAPEHPHGTRPVALNDVVSFRYDHFDYFKNPSWKQAVPIHPPLLQWLEGVFEAKAID